MDIIERIKKLYNLSTRNSNTAEAASAAAKIQELCFNHELDLEKILAQGTDPKEKYVKYDYMLPEATRTDVGWKRTLFGGVAKGNFCQPVYIPKTTKMAVVGQKHNFEAVCYTYEYLTREIQRLAIDHCIEQGFLVSKDKRRYIQGFCEGATAEVYRSLTAGIKAQAEKSSDSRALVVVKGKELADATKIHFPNLRHTTRRAGGSASGHADGRRAGQSISVNRGIGGSSRTQIG